MKIFISYRRSDTQYFSERIFDRLIVFFGMDSVFIDLYSIPVGVNFQDAIVNVLGIADVVLVVIGSQWLTVLNNDGRARLTDIDDPVRLEIETAIRLEKAIIPVLATSVYMPKPMQLPPSLQQLAYINAIEIRPGRDFNSDIQKLVNAISERCIHCENSKYEGQESIITELFSEENGLRSTPYILRMLLRAVNDWYNEIVDALAKLQNYEQQQLLEGGTTSLGFAYVWRRLYIQNVITALDILSKNSNMNQIVEETDKFLDMLIKKDTRHGRTQDNINEGRYAASKTCRDLFTVGMSGKGENDIVVLDELAKQLQLVTTAIHKKMDATAIDNVNSRLTPR